MTAQQSGVFALSFDHRSLGYRIIVGGWGIAGEDLVATAFEKVGAAGEFDAGPLAADGGPKGILPAASVFLEVSATHDFDDFAVGAFGIEAARIKAVYICMPPQPERPKPRPFVQDRRPLHQDVVAAMTALFAAACDLVRGRGEGLDDFLDDQIEQHKRQDKGFESEAKGRGGALWGDAFGWRAGLLRGFGAPVMRTGRHGGSFTGAVGGAEDRSSIF